MGGRVVRGARMTSPLDVVRGYIGRGWAPVPIPYREKGPILTEWQNLRITAETAGQYFDSAAQNVGVILGEASGGLADVDLDCPEATAVAPYFLPRTGAIFGRASARAAHWLFVVGEPADRAVEKLGDPDVPGGRATIVELRRGGPNGAQTVFPGSAHMDTGELIRWEQDGEPAAVDAADLRGRVRRLAAAALIARCWRGPGNRHDDALTLGGVLHRAGLAESEAKVFVEAVARAAGDPEWRDRVRAAEVKPGAHARGFPALAKWLGDRRAKAVADWLDYGEAEEIPVYGFIEPVELGAGEEMPVFGGRRVREIAAPAVPSRARFLALFPRDTPFPIQSFADCPGLLGEVAAHLDEASATSTEAGGLAASLAVLGACMGRSYETPTGLRTNVYAIMLGESGDGKTALVKPAKEVMELAGVGDLIGPSNFASGPGVLSALAARPAMVSFSDEIGRLLQRIGDRGAASHERAIVDEFTKLYSAANTIHTGTAYASVEATRVCEPHLCILGTSTPEGFWRAFGSSTLEDGSAARWLAFPLGETGVQAPRLDRRDDAVAGLRRLRAAVQARVVGNLGQPQVYTVPWAPGVEAAWTALRDLMAGSAVAARRDGVKGASAILRRVAENAMKIALVSAVGRNPEEPRMERIDLDVGHALARWSATSMIWGVAAHVADNDTERDALAIERFIREAGKDGRTRSEITKRFERLRKVDRDERLATLVEGGRVRMVKGATTAQGGAPGARYFPVPSGFFPVISVGRAEKTLPEKLA
jgi:hypothetical protein